MMCAVAGLLCWQTAGQTQNQDEARAIIGKAIKAMGVDKEPQGAKGLLIKSKGTLELMGMTVNIVQTITLRYPDQFKDFTELDINNMKLPVSTVFDGKKGWVAVNDKVIMKFDDIFNAEMKEVANLVNIGKLKPLLDKKYDLAVIGEVKVEDKPAVGVRVSVKGAKDVSVYFDKNTHLLMKVERQAVDATTKQEVTEERIIRSYKDRDGYKVPHEVAILRDGKKFVEVEVTEHTHLDNVDPGEFEMPK